MLPVVKMDLFFFVGTIEAGSYRLTIFATSLPHDPEIVNRKLICY